MTKTTFVPLTPIKSQEVNDNFDGLVSGALDADNNRLALTRQHALADFVVSGLTIATSSSLASTIASGKAYISDGTYRNLVSTNNVNKTFTASKDTYIDMDSAGNLYYVEVANGATTGMTLTANCHRIAKVVTSASAVTSVTQIGADTLGNAIFNTNPTPRYSLNKPPFIAFRKNGNQALGGGVWTQVTNFTSVYNPQSWNLDVTNHKLFVPFAGYYQINGNIDNQVAAGGDQLIGLGINSAASAGNRGWTRFSIGNLTNFRSQRLLLNANDYIIFWYYSGGGGTIIGANDPYAAQGDGSWFEVEYLGAA